jgi:hypothetical protein
VALLQLQPRRIPDPLQAQQRRIDVQHDQGEIREPPAEQGDTAQINEALCHNICVLIHSMHEFGIDPGLGQQPA